MSLKYVERSTPVLSNWNLTYLSRLLYVMELAPFALRGCQGFIGPYPSAFLDKNYIKNWCAKVKEQLTLPKIIVQRSLNINGLKANGPEKH